MPHLGCIAVEQGHQSLFEQIGISRSRNFYRKDLWWLKRLSSFREMVDAVIRSFGREIAGSDGVFLNGEGTVHHGAGSDLLAFLVAAQQLGKPTVVFNTMLQEHSLAIEVFRGATLVVLRDKLSLSQAKASGVSATFVPDSIVFSEFGDPRKPQSRQEITLITDYWGTVRSTAGWIVDRALHDLDDARSMPLSSLAWATNTDEAIERFGQAQSVVSARHHGLYMAALTGTPMVALESNSHKMEGFLKSFAAPIEMVTDYEELGPAVERAVDNRVFFEDLRDSLIDPKWRSLALELLGNVFVDQVPRNGFDRAEVDLSSSETGRRVGLAKLSDERLVSLKNFLSKSGSKWPNPQQFSEKMLAGYLGGVPLSRVVQKLLALSPGLILTPRIWLAIAVSVVNRGLDPLLKLSLWELFLRRRANKIELMALALRKGADGFVLALLDRFWRRGGEYSLAFRINLLVPVLWKASRFKELASLFETSIWRVVDTRNAMKIADALTRIGRIDLASLAYRSLESAQEPLISQQIQHHLGRLLVKRGIPDGWKMMGSVLERRHFQDVLKEFPGSRWDSSSAVPRQLFIWFHPLGGLGFELMMVKFVLPLSRETGAELYCAVDRRLVKTLGELFPGPKFIPRDGLNLKKLPVEAQLVFAREMPEILLNRGLQLEEALVTEQIRLERGLGDMSSPRRPSLRPRVAISWKTTNSLSAGYRNVPLRDFGSTLSKFDFDYFAFQHGEIEDDLMVIRETLGSRIAISPVSPASDLWEIGQFLRSMDFVITVDNSTLHFAGTFSVPTIGLLSIPSYWQWPIKGSRSYWYSSVTLMRQKAPGHWQSVFEEVEAALTRYARDGSFIGLE